MKKRKIEFFILFLFHSSLFSLSLSTLSNKAEINKNPSRYNFHHTFFPLLSLAHSSVAPCAHVRACVCV